jgi:Fic family protein
MDKKLRFDFVTSQQIIKKIGLIDAFKGKWLAIEKEENRYLKELRKIARVESIGSSTRIEGSNLSNAEIQSLIENLKISKLKTRDEQEVIGYYEVLELILDNYQDIDISERDIFQLHNVLLKHSDKDVGHKGKFKKLSNKVVATYPGGEQKVIFNTTEPFLVKKEMETALLWTNEKISEENFHSLIIIGLFIYEFLSIHPFQDGNGRLSRLLTTLLLLKSDYHFIQYVSLEHQIEKKKKAYYKALMDAQQKRNTEEEIISKWILFFLDSVIEITQKLELKYGAFKSLGTYLNKRQKEVLGFIKKNEPTKIGDLNDSLESISRNTLKKDILYLKQEGLIEALGQGKGSFYVIKKETS